MRSEEENAASIEARRIAQIIVDAPDEWTPHFTRSELLPLAKTLLAAGAVVSRTGDEQ